MLSNKLLIMHLTKTAFTKKATTNYLFQFLFVHELQKKYNILNLCKKIFFEPYCCNAFNIGKYISNVCEQYKREPFRYCDWINSLYMPTPSQSLKQHNHFIGDITLKRYQEMMQAQ